ncbi:unnamed protein product [Blepharisma stoltei]|uniref:Pre-mRNA-splicing factor SYF1 n=1 Tax=Blepharisma stoltei TaxID=1481888 RepID=A0AAU9IM16_9CILI|nr:unnamed protein product [Blepharisma stoltei]
MANVFFPPDLNTEDLIHNPYSQRAWWNCIQVAPTFLEKCNLYERSLSYIPGSYKLWYNYLSEVSQYVSESPSEEHYELANLLFERALRYMYLMPKIWLIYLDFLISQDHITKTRRMFDYSLQQLPLTQHDLIWDKYLEWAETIPIHETTRRIYIRYLQFNPFFIEEYIDFLVKYQYSSEAITLILEVVENDEASTLWNTLARLVSQNPDAVENSKEILERCMGRMEDQGRAWEMLAEFYIRRGEIEEARRVYKKALADVKSVRDFGVVFAAYSQLEEELLNLYVSEGYPQDVIDSEMKILEELLDSREFLLSDVKIKETPNDVNEWKSRVKLHEGDIVEMLRTYAEAVTILDPMKAIGRPQDLWIEFAKLYEKNGDMKSARIVLDKATKSKFKNPKQLEAVCEAWIEMELEHRHYGDALKLAKHFCNWHAKKYSKELSLQQEVSMRTQLWGLYVDLEESLGTTESVKAVYDRMISLKIATPQAILNYSSYLQNNEFWEESFRVYEQGINNFSWPFIYDIWISYLTSFVKHYGEKKLERARDLFEQVLTNCPKDKKKIFFCLYAKLEEEYGLLNHSIEIYSKAIKEVLDSEKVEMLYVYLQKTCDYFGIFKMRKLFEEVYEVLNIPTQVIEIGLKFANIERKLGEIDRARSIYNYISQFCDPRKPEEEEFWKVWHDFEVYHGNEDTFREMMRIKRTVITKFAGAGILIEDDK